VNSAEAVAMRRNGFKSLAGTLIGLVKVEMAAN